MTDPRPSIGPNDEPDAAEPPRGDRLDALLRAWHDEHRDAAGLLRDRVLTTAREAGLGRSPGIAGRIGFARFLATAALLAIVAVLATLLVRGPEQPAFALGGIAQVAEGGALDALDDDGQVLGPCPLQRTDVRVEISGLFARTYVEQTYSNPYPRTIEAVYAFPLPSGAAVDRMTMVVRGPEGERFIEGEVKERALARAIYEEARESGHVASLLEQERPNVFTQSVANLEPGATVRIRIATIELVRRRDGVAEYVFPLVVGPRYVPGRPASMPALPEGWRVREGVVLRAPAAIEIGADGAIAPARMLALLEGAIPIAPTSAERVDLLLGSGELIAFTAKYGNGSAERGTYSPSTGIGDLHGRFFLAPPAKDAGTGFATDTDAVPDASRITPMPVPPAERAGHDVSISVLLDSGGPEVTSVESALHAVRVTNPEGRASGVRRIELEDARSIPNRDFILRWRIADGSIEPAFFAYRSDSPDPSVAGGYFAVLVEPPARVAPADVRPRELVFVLDVSGSMNGFPIEKSKALVRKALAAMRPDDVFNVITFAGATSVLWPEPRPATEENRRRADEFVNGAYGSGGTEMMAAIEAALVQEGRSGLAPARLLDLPADGRRVRVVVAHDALSAGGNGVPTSIDAGPAADGSPRRVALALPVALPSNPKRLAVILDGAWETRAGERILVARSARFEDADARTRIVVFLTDGYIGNDRGVVAAVRDNARASRVFGFGIGNSVNRFLLEEMARAGRGACEVVTIADEADPVVERLVRRIDAPVLTDLSLEISPGLSVHDLMPSGEHLPDLFDHEPIVILGRYDRPGRGTITLRGRTGAGAWERSIEVELPATPGGSDVVPTLWARAAVDALLLPKLAAVESQSLDLPTKQAVIRLGERYRISTPYTSFVAVEKSRVVVGGRPILVGVPVELPEGTNWNGFFGEGARPEAIVVANAGSEGRIAEIAARLESQLVARGFVASARAAVESESGETFGADPNSRTLMLYASQSMAVAMAPAMPSTPGGGVGGGGGGVPSVPPPGARQERLAFGRDAATPAKAAAAPAPATASAASPSTTSARPREIAQRRSAGVAVRARETSGLALGTNAPAVESPSEPAPEPSSFNADDAFRDRLVRVLERRLALVALAALVGDRGDPTALAAAFGLEMTDARLSLAVRVAPGEADRVAAELMKAGLDVAGIDAARDLLVLRAKPEELAGLTELDGVRRVEPLVMASASAPASDPSDR